MNDKINELYNNLDAKDKIINEQALEIARLKEEIDRVISFIKILQNNLKDYTEYEEYTNIFNEMLKDILGILEAKNESNM